MLHEPGDNCKQEARRQPEHQYTDNAFQRAYRSPPEREDDIPVADRRIARSGEIERRFPCCEAFPTIEPRPQQDLQRVQAHDQAGQSNHQHSGAHWPEPAAASAQVDSCPLDKGRHARALQYKRDRHEQYCRRGFMDEKHGSDLPGVRAMVTSATALPPQASLVFRRLLLVKTPLQEV